MVDFIESFSASNIYFCLNINLTNIHLIQFKHFYALCINYDITIYLICFCIVYYWIQLTIVYLGINLCAYILFRDNM